MSGCSDIITEYTLKTPDVSHFYKDVTEATEVELIGLPGNILLSIELKLLYNEFLCV